MQHTSVTFPGPMRVVWNSSPERGESMPFSYIDWQPPAARSATMAIILLNVANVEV
jgi:hypothetical protein